MPDLIVTCIDCGTPFIYSEKDQAFYEKNNYVPPKRCKACRQIKKAKQNAAGM